MYKLTEKQFIPRGSFLKDSDYIYCIAVYTGDDTKLQQNIGKYQYKRSIIHSRLNRVFFYTFIGLTVGISICCMYNRLWTQELYGKHWYIEFDEEETGFMGTLKSFISLFLLCNYIIPIDVHIMLQLVDILYSYYLKNDGKMTYLKEGQIRHASINSQYSIEDLGEVEFIMSDKTGTLTKN